MYNTYEAKINRLNDFAVLLISRKENEYNIKADNKSNGVNKETKIFIKGVLGQRYWKPKPSSENELKAQHSA